MKVAEKRGHLDDARSGAGFGVESAALAARPEPGCEAALDADRRRWHRYAVLVHRERLEDIVVVRLVHARIHDSPRFLNQCCA